MKLLMQPVVQLLDLVPRPHDLLPPEVNVILLRDGIKLVRRVLGLFRGLALLLMLVQFIFQAYCQFGRLPHYGNWHCLHHLHLAIFDLLLHLLLLLQHQATLRELLAVLFHVLLVLFGLIENSLRDLLVCLKNLLMRPRLLFLSNNCHVGVNLREHRGREALSTIKFVLGEVSRCVA